MSVAAEMKVDHPLSRHLAIGAEIVPEGGVHFRVWAPDRKNVDVILESENHAPGQEVCSRLQPEDDGYFAGHVAEAHAGARYRFRLDGGTQRYPHPASRFQPEGPHGPTEVIDPFDFKWTDKNWNGIGVEGQVIYEMHIGTFSKEGTWEAAERELNELADSGITVLEVMPLADFPGRFGWGYDGCSLQSFARRQPSWPNALLQRNRERQLLSISVRGAALLHGLHRLRQHA
jgi:maltooligosyltrehalose trehalohydrolase